MEINVLNSSYRQNFDTLDDLFERQKNWVKHDVIHLNYDECKRLSENLTVDSRCETAKAILYTIVVMLVYVAIIASTVVLGELINSYFVLELDMPNLGTALQCLVIVVIPIMGTVQFLLPIMWKSFYFWEHSDHLTEQEKACADRMRLLEQQRV